MFCVVLCFYIFQFGILQNIFKESNTLKGMLDVLNLFDIMSHFTLSSVSQGPRTYFSISIRNEQIIVAQKRLSEHSDIDIVPACS